MDEFQQKIQLQRVFYKSGATLPLEFRLKQLQSLKSLLINEKSTLCEAVFKDLRRRPELTDFYEIHVILREIDNFIANLKEWMKPEPVKKSAPFLLDSVYVQREPYGVVLMISPFNYPICLTLVPLVAILGAGNTCIVKPSEFTAHTSTAFQELFARYFDPQVCDVVQADGPGTAQLLEHRFDHICYTGSTRIGRLVLEAASKHLTPTVLELGGQCPVIIDETADLESSARRLLWGKTSNAGQTCLAPNHLLVTRPVLDKLAPIMERTLRDFYGDDAQKSADFMRLPTLRHFDRIAGALAETRGRVLTQLGRVDRADRFVPPTLVEVRPDDPLMAEELFAPVLPVVVVESAQAALHSVRAGEKPLAAYLFSNDAQLTKRFVETVECGNVAINDVVLNFAVDSLPFGGVGHSGMGRYRGRYGFEAFTNLKSVLHRSLRFEGVMWIRYPPLTALKQFLMAGAAQRTDLPAWVGPALSRLAWLLVGVGLGAAFRHCRNNQFSLQSLRP